MPAALSPPPQSVFGESIVLSPVEDLVSRVDERFDGAGRVAVLIRVDGCLEAEFLEPALARVQARHPKLRAVITPGADGRRRYHLNGNVPAIPFSIKDGTGTDLPWREETGQLLRTGLAPGTGPLAAITVLRDRSRRQCYLILVAHHAIADGLSAITLAGDLLSEYEISEQHVQTELGASSLPLRSVSKARSTASLLQRARHFGRFIQLWREEQKLDWTGLPGAADIRPYSQWEHHVFSKQDTLALVRQCRRQRVSLSGALCAAVLCGLMDCLRVSDARFKCKFPIDVRSELDDPDGPVGAQDLGCFASVLQQFYRLRQPLSFWDLARRSHHDLQRFVEDGGPSLIYNMASTVRKLKAPKKFKRGTLLLTNYGVASLRNHYGTLQLRACTLVFKNDVVGPSLIVEALVLGQELNLGLNAFDLDPAFWQAFQVAVRRYLDEAIGGTSLADQPETFTRVGHRD